MCGKLTIFEDGGAQWVEKKTSKRIVAIALDILSGILLWQVFRAYKDDLFKWSDQIGVVVNA